MAQYSFPIGVKCLLVGGPSFPGLWRLALILPMFVGFVVAGFGADVETEADFLGRGSALIQKGDFAAALEVLTDGVKALPKSALLWRTRGSVYLSSEMPEEGLVDLGRALQIDPNDAQTLLFRGAAYARIGQPNKALADLDRAYSLGERSGLLFSTRAEMRMKGRKFAGVVDDCSRALEMDPKDAGMFILRGEAKSELRQYELAIEDFNDAIKLNSRIFEAYTLRAAAYRWLGKIDEAYADVSFAVVGTREKAPKPLVERAQIRLFQDNAADALADLDKAVELGSVDFLNVWSCQAQAFFELRRFEESRQALTKLLGLNEVPFWRKQRARTLAHLGEFKPAAVDLSVAIKGKPDDRDGYLGRADIHAWMGDLERAYDDYERAFQLGEQGESYARLRWLLVARRLKRTDQETKFAEDLEKWSYGARWLIGRFLVGASDERDLLRGLKEADPKLTRDEWCSAYYSVGVMQLLNGSSEKAREAFRRCVELDAWRLPEYIAAKADLARMDAAAK
jgi:tetratricopeptide (TPR) repeat protein